MIYIGLIIDLCYNYDVGFQQPREYKEKVFSKTWYLATLLRSNSGIRKPLNIQNKKKDNP